MQNLRWIPVFVLSVFVIYGGTAWCVSAKHQLQVSVAARQALEVTPISSVSTLVNGQTVWLETYHIKVRSNDSARAWTVLTGKGEQVLSGRAGLTETDYLYKTTDSDLDHEFHLVCDL